MKITLNSNKKKINIELRFDLKYLIKINNEKQKFVSEKNFV